MSQPSILDLMDRDDFLGPFFKGASWAPWRAFLAALFALTMDEAQAAVYRQHTGRQTLPAQPFTEADLICGRRAGKSRILALIAVYLATMRDYTPYLAPGEVATIAVLAQDRAAAGVIFGYALGMLEAVPVLRATLGNTTNEIIPMPGERVQIRIATASFKAARGYTYAAVCGDETAFWQTDEASANPDEEVLRAIRPGLATIPGAMLLIASSPHAKRGSLYTAFRKHYGQDGARVLVWKAATLDMHPTLNREIVEAAYEDDPIAADAEFGANFRNDVSGFVAREVVEAAVVAGRRETLRVPGIRYVAFVDPSGGTNDSFTLAIAHEADKRAVLDVVRETKPPLSPEGTVAQYAELLKAYGITSVTGDRYAGEWPREQFRKNGIAYELTDRFTSDLYRDLLPLLNSGTVELLDLPVLVNQLCNLERRTTRGGRESIAHPPGGHDDVANAAAGVLLLASVRRQRIIVSADCVERSRTKTWKGARQ